MIMTYEKIYYPSIGETAWAVNIKPTDTLSDLLSKKNRVIPSIILEIGSDNFCFVAEFPRTKLQLENFNFVHKFPTYVFKNKSEAEKFYIDRILNELESRRSGISEFLENLIQCAQNIINSKI